MYIHLTFLRVSQDSIGKWQTVQFYSAEIRTSSRLHGTLLLRRLQGLEAIYRKPNTSKPAREHRIYPYLLKGVAVDRVNQVWAADITYLPMSRGFLYLVAIMDWHSRYVLAWKLSNTLDADFCIDALKEALSKG